MDVNNLEYRLSITTSTNRGKEKSPSDGHCQFKKEMEDQLLACQQCFEKVPYIYTPRYVASIIFENK
jgi:hypothetical protein